MMSVRQNWFKENLHDIIAQGRRDVFSTVFLSEISTVRHVIFPSITQPFSLTQTLKFPLSSLAVVEHISLNGKYTECDLLNTYP